MASPAAPPQGGGGPIIGLVISPVSLRVAQAVGVTASTWLAAQTTAVSTLAAPTMLLSPAHLLLAQWAKLNNLPQRNIGLVLRLISSSTIAYLTSRLPRGSPIHSIPLKLHLIASALLLLPVPITYFLQRPASLELARRANEAAASQDPTAHVAAHESAIAAEQKRKAKFPEDFTPHTLPSFLSTHVAPGAAWPFFEAGGVTVPDDKELSAHQLLDKWAWIGLLGDAAVTVVGAACAAWGVLGQGVAFEMFLPNAP